MTVRDFLRWWGGQLAALMPAVWREEKRALVGVALLSTPGAEPFTIEVNGVAGRLSSANPQILTLTGDEPLRLSKALGRNGERPRLYLRLPSGAVLEREVILPIAAERAPAQILGFEFDRLTPFRAEETFWTFTVVRRDRANGKLHLRLTFTPRAPLAALLDLLNQVGVTIRLEASVLGRGSREIPLQPAAIERRSSGLRLQAAACAALALAVVVIPLIRQSSELADTKARVAILQPEATQAAALQRRMAGNSAGGDALQAERVRVGDPMQALAAVTQALPDDTWLTDLALHQRRLSLSGQSEAAVKLIARLGAEPALRNVAFSAPVTRAESRHGDLFSISAELTP